MLMHNILIIGNVTKDVYLRMDNRLNEFEVDQNKVSWLDISFNNSSHHFYSRFSVYGGASISLEVFSRFGIDAQIASTPASFLDGQFITKDTDTDYRYILCKDDDAAYLAPSTKRDSKWEEPEEKPEWIYIDRSARLNPQISEKILAYLNANPDIKLALFTTDHTNQNANYVQKLIQRANFLISDVRLNNPHKNVANITPKHIYWSQRRISWSLEKRDLITRLSAHQTIGATLLAATILGRKPEDALLLAYANVVNSKLGNTSNLQTLEQRILGEQHRIEYKQKGNMSPEIVKTTQQLMTPGKGILAADESGGSIHKKFEKMNIPDTEQFRREYRNLFFTTPTIEKYVSGIILFDETARQKADNGKDFVTFLREKGIIAGIKVDKGLVNFDNTEEKWTQGLDDLPQRLAEYYKMGARFAKWRAAFELTATTPSDMAIKRNCEILAQYAIDCQDANIVPIVEPELVYDGDYTIEQNIETTGKILDQLFAELKAKDVLLQGCILKVNMVLAGKKQEHQSTPEEVGRATAEVLRTHVPSALGGVVFLSGGQTVQQATDNLQAVTNNGPFPWQVTFSYARALQEPALVVWHGDSRFSDIAREAFRQRLIANTNALHKNN